MRLVDDEYRLLSRTGRLGPVLADRLRELRERPVVAAVSADPPGGERESVRVRVRVRWLRLIRPPG